MTNAVITCCVPADEFGAFQYYETFEGSAEGSREYHCNADCSQPQCDVMTGEPCPGECGETDDPCCILGVTETTVTMNGDFHALGSGSINFTFQYAATLEDTGCGDGPPLEDDGIAATCELIITGPGVDSSTISEDYLDNMSLVTSGSGLKAYATIDSLNPGGVVNLSIPFSALTPGCNYTISASSGVGCVNNAGAHKDIAMLSATDAGMALVITNTGDCCTKDDNTTIHVP